ncbi:MAG: hypothetical protein IPP17_21750 [Bacteroidetes bacterium]|nr:hypothetical protein [Bacteroidota bacterium]
MRGLRFPYNLGLFVLLALVAGMLVATVATRAGLQFGYSEGISTVLVILFSMAAAAISFFIYHQRDGMLPLRRRFPWVFCGTRFCSLRR